MKSDKFVWKFYVVPSSSRCGGGCAFAGRASIRMKGVVGGNPSTFPAITTTTTLGEVRIYICMLYGREGRGRVTREIEKSSAPQGRCAEKGRR